MNHQHIPSLIFHLYAGVPNGMEHLLDTCVVFRDPVAIVKGRKPVLSMFKKLNHIFPAAQVLQIECLEQEAQHSRWTLRINYRKNGHKHTLEMDPFHTELIIQFSKTDQIKSITEHWKKPFDIRGDGQNPLLIAGRRFFGITLGLPFPRQFKK